MEPNFHSLLNKIASIKMISEFDDNDSKEELNKIINETLEYIRIH